MSAKIPAYSDIGRSTRDLLSGSGTTGVYQFNNVFNLSSKTADGVEFTATSTQKGDALETIVKAAYATKGYSFSGSVLPNGKALVTLTAKGLAPNLTAALSGTLPDEQSGKLTVDYSVPHVTLKTTVGLTQNPKVVVAATTGQRGVVAGAEVTYDTGKGNITGWNAGAAYNAADFQAGVGLLDNGNTLKAAYAHNIDAFQSVGGEITKPLNNDSDVSIALGYSRRLVDGALAKAKLQNNGTVSLLYQTELKPKTLIGIATQFDGTNPNTKPKIGFAFDLKN